MAIRIPVSTASFLTFAQEKAENKVTAKLVTVNGDVLPVRCDGIVRDLRDPVEVMEVVTSAPEVNVNRKNSVTEAGNRHKFSGADFLAYLETESVKPENKPRKRGRQADNPADNTSATDAHAAEGSPVPSANGK